MKSAIRLRRKITNDCRGQALVEFALIAVVLIALVLGVLEIGRMVLCYTTVANAARAGARYAITHASVPPTTSTAGSVAAMKNKVTAVVKSFAAAGTLNTDPAKLTISVSYSCSTSPCADATTVGNFVSVTVRYSYDPLMTYYFSPSSIKLGSTSEGVITW